LLLFTACKQSKKKENSTTVKLLASSQLIVPHQQIGRFEINSDVVRTVKRLGQPDRGDAAMGKAMMTWKDVKGSALTIFTTRQMGVEPVSRLKIIRTQSPYFKTKTQLGVGSSLAALQAEFTLDKVRTFTVQNTSYQLYLGKGIGFEIAADSTCYGVVVMAEDSYPQQSYLPLYPTFKPAP